jgi:hypothetical protein
MIWLPVSPPTHFRFFVISLSKRVALFHAGNKLAAGSAATKKHEAVGGVTNFPVWISPLRRPDA